MRARKAFARQNSLPMDFARSALGVSCVFASILPVMRMPEQPALRTSRVRRWRGHLFREWTMETWRPIAPASAKPEPSQWSDAQVTLAWIGHSTVLINFFGITILTDPVLCPRIGIRLPGFTIGPKRLTAPALGFDELPKVDLVLLSHAHFDHLDLRTLRCFDESTSVITARATRDLLKRTRFSHVTELDWGQRKNLRYCCGQDRNYCVPCEALGRAHAAGHAPRLQWILNPTKRK